MTPQEKLAQAQAALVAFQADHPLSREEAQANARVWLDNAKRVTAIELGAVFRGGGELQFEHLSAAARAFAISSPEFEGWVLSQLDEDALLPAAKREKQLHKLQAAVREAERAIVRSELEGQKQQVE